MVPIEILILTILDQHQVITMVELELSPSMEEFQMEDMEMLSILDF